MLSEITQGPDKKTHPVLMNTIRHQVKEFCSTLRRFMKTQENCKEIWKQQGHSYSYRTLGISRVISQINSSRTG